MRLFQAPQNCIASPSHQLSRQASLLAKRYISQRKSIISLNPNSGDRKRKTAHIYPIPLHPRNRRAYPLLVTQQARCPTRRAALLDLALQVAAGHYSLHIQHHISRQILVKIFPNVPFLSLPGAQPHASPPRLLRRECLRGLYYGCIGRRYRPSARMAYSPR